MGGPLPTRHLLVAARVLTARAPRELLVQQAEETMCRTVLNRLRGAGSRWQRARPSLLLGSEGTRNGARGKRARLRPPSPPLPSPALTTLCRRL